MSEPAPPQQQPVIYRIPATLLVPAVGAAGYALAHSFESGYMRFFGLPNTLVRVSLNTAIVATGSFLSAVFFAIYMSFWASAGLVNERGRLGLGQKWAVAIIFTVYVLTALLDPGWKVSVVIVIGTILFVAGVQWLASYVRKREEKLGVQPQPDTTHGAWVLAARWIGWDGVLMLLLFLGADFLAHGIGSYKASREEDFFTLDDPPGFVVLRVYDDAVIAASLNRQDKTVGPEIRVIKPERLAARREVLGRLEASKLAAPAAVSQPAVATPEPRPPSQAPGKLKGR